MSRADSRFPLRRLAGALPLLLASLGGAAPLRAQAPVITPAGDPSVRDDTIYALAVDSTKHREESYVWLLDDGVLRLEADGTGTRTYRQVIQILQPSAVDGFAEHTFGYDADREELVLNWARVVGLDGKVVSARPIQSQVSDLPAPEQSPVYQHRKRLRISLGGVAPGTIVDYSYTLRVKVPVLRGDFYSGWTINAGTTIRRSRLVLDAPEGVPIRIRERNLDFVPTVQRVKGRIVRSWARSDLEHRTPELYATTDSNKVVQGVTASGAIEWADVARWYGGLVRGRYAVTPALEARLAEVVAGARTRPDTLRALHRWVAQDIRYLSIALGMGGYRPRPPEEVMRTASGDCKDKATLFITLARRLGYQAYPVLAQSSGWAERESPSIDQFNHMIAAIRLSAGDTAWTFVDLTADLVPLGEIPPAVAGDFGLLIHDDGTHEEVRFPRFIAERNRAAALLVGTLDPAGRFDGWATLSWTGATQYEIREQLSQPFTAEQRIAMANAMAAHLVEGATGDSLQLLDGKDLNTPARIRLHLVAEQALKQGAAFMLPFTRYVSPTQLGKLEREKTRAFPFAARAVFGPHENVEEMRLTIPAGWSVDLPRGVRAQSAFGSYAATYEQNGRELVVRRVMSGNDRVLPPESKPELIEWLRELGKDDATFLMLRPPTPAAAAR